MYKKLFSKSARVNADHFSEKKYLLATAIALALGAAGTTAYAANISPIGSTIISANSDGTTQSAPAAKAIPRQLVIKLKAGTSVAAANASKVSASLSGVDLQSTAPALNALMQKHRISKSEALLKRSNNPAARAAAKSSLAQSHADGLDRTYLLTVPDGDIETIAKEFAQDPSIEYARPNHIATVQMVPNDTYYSTSGSFGQAGYADLWGVKNLVPETAWDTTQGLGITVAVIDTGVAITHEDLSANIWINTGEIPGNGIDDDNNGYVDDLNGYDFIGASVYTPTADNNPADVHGHGTHVAGIIAAVGNNAKGVIGVAPKAKIMPVRVLDNDGSGGDFQVAQGIVYAVDNGARVINMSLGGSGVSIAERDAIAYAHSLGVVVVVAAGNEKADANNFAPANDERAITVGAITPQLTLASYSNFGPKIDVVAPGSDILSTLAAGSKIETEYLASSPGKIVGQKYVILNGTSMASPMVAGAVALMLAKTPALLPDEVRYRLKKNAVDMGATLWDAKFGSGRVNVNATVADTSTASRTSAFIRTPFVGAAAPNNIWVGNQSVVVTGKASGSNCIGYELAYAQLSGDTVGSFVNFASGSAIDGTLGTLNPASLTDGGYILRLTSKDANGTSTTTYTNLIKDSSLRSGWPSLANYWRGFSGLQLARPEAQALSFADLNNDGFKEVISARGNSIFAWNRDGSAFAGFPLNTSRDFSAPLAIADLDGDGKQEIVGIGYNDFSAPVYVVGFNGVVKTGFPAGQPGTSPHPAPSFLSAAAAPAIADLDGDGKKEIIFTGRTMRGNLTNYVYLNVIGYDGQQKAGWPKSWTIYNDNIEAPKVTVADVDGNGTPEILVTSLDANNKAHLLAYTPAGVLSKDVTLDTMPAFILPEVLVADMNNDGSAEVFVGAYDRAYLFDKNLTLLAGWPKLLPVSGYFANSFQLAMIDVERNGSLEAIYLSRPDDSSGGFYNTSPLVMHAFKMNGTEAAGYPSQFDPLIFPPEGGAVVYNNTITPPVSAPLTKAAGNSLFLNSFFTSFVGRTGGAAALAGWPKSIPLSQSAPTIGDLENDGNLEIATFSNDGMVYIFSETGVSNVASTWPTINANNARTNAVPYTPANFAKTYPQVYLRGTNNSWAATTMTQVGNYTWQLDATFGSTATERFKFDIYNNWATNFGENNAGCTTSCVAEQNGADIAITQGAGVYRIQFNDSTKAYSVVKQGVVNQAPIARAGNDQTLAGAANVTLNGSTSSDPDGTIVSYQWVQTAGPTVILQNPTQAQAQIILPIYSGVPTVFSFQLTVTDNQGASSTSTTNVQQIGGSFSSTYSQVYFRGTPNNWLTDRQMSLVASNIWQIDVVFGGASTDRFKFDIFANWATNFGDNNGDRIADASGADIYVTVAGTYRIRFNDQTKAYSVTKL